MNKSPALVTLGPEEVLPFVGQRLDVFLAAALDRSRTHVQSLLKQGLVELKPVTAKAESSYRLRKGDSAIVQPVEALPIDTEPSGEAIPLDILYEDEVLIAINKQPGLVVHPAAGHWSGTLVNALIHHRGSQLAERGGADRKSVV